MKSAIKLCVILPFFAIGCQSWAQSHPQEVTDAKDLTVCIFEGAISGLSPEVIAVKCGGLAVEDVLTILSEGDKFAQYKAAREKSAVDKAAP